MIRNLYNLGLISLCSSIPLTATAAVVINEFDYDQPGTDTAEFIELYNNGEAQLSLDSYRVELINGSSSATYRSIDLSGFDIGAGGFFVMCADASMVMNCDYSFTTSNGWLQNGAPDAIALLQDTTLIDSVSYEGILIPYTETDAPAVSDSNTEILSIGRMFDGTDSGNNAIDFDENCITPGTANIIGRGDCSMAAVSAVPVPAAAWLFASGLIGIAGLSRRR